LLKFYLRMGFDDMSEKKFENPLLGLMTEMLQNSLSGACEKGRICGTGDVR
jgi:hypothetical protein